MELWIFWLIAAIVLIIVELFTQWITTLCFAVGSVAALIATLLGCPASTQLIVLALAALITFFVAGPKVLRHNQQIDAAQFSNIDALRGRHAQVTTAINPQQPGRVKVDGDSWQARLVDADANTTVPAGEIVEIVGYDSIILLVKRG
jgi:membrane protein implicated in regulation of membrane protease activity